MSSIKETIEFLKKNLDEEESALKTWEKRFEIVAANLRRAQESVGAIRVAIDALEVTVGQEDVEDDAHLNGGDV